MVKLSEEIKNEIIKLYQENVSTKDIINNLKISSATYYRVIKEYKNLSVNFESSERNTERNTEKNTEKSDLNTTTSYDEDEETNIDKEESNNVFDIDNFKKELNGSQRDIDEDDNHYAENIDDIKKEEEIIPEILKPIRRPLPTEKSVLSNISFAKNKKNTVSNIIDKSNIIDTIKNVNSGGTLDELKEKRSLIIIIRQYINTFEKELINIYGRKNDFEKKLFTQSIDQLKIILENIRIQMNLNRNKDMFINGVSIGLKGLETISNYSGYDVTGLEYELMNDPNFLLDLQIIQAEVDISKYINPKVSALLKVVKKMYQKNKENEIKKQMDNVINDKEKLEKIKNLK